ncbi:prolyl oligopeptidase-like protein [Xylogone sp. PMI_703]|nr:prolyl oligopeptidase-like protein [Xylogone sp. PMI_703]
MVSPSLPVQMPSASFFQGVVHRIRIGFIRLLTDTIMNILDLPGIRDPSTQPTFKKSYPCQPTLTHRVFVPKTWKSGDPALPLYIDLHGGGYALFKPQVDDKYCSWLANQHNVLVISVQYLLGPTNLFPKPLYGVRDVILAIIEDDSLPAFDKLKVCVGGFSAGAGFSLTVTQLPELKGRIRGVVAFYPPTNYVTPVKESIAARPAHAGPDVLASLAELFKWGYVPVGQDLADPLLSPAFAKREDLPPKICIVGCEFDFLCKNAEILANRLAESGTGERTGTETAWEQNGIRWEMMRGKYHAFDMPLVQPRRAVKRAILDARSKAMWSGASNWLMREVYS